MDLSPETEYQIERFRTAAEGLTDACAAIGVAADYAAGAFHALATELPDIEEPGEDDFFEVAPRGVRLVQFSDALNPCAHVEAKLLGFDAAGRATIHVLGKKYEVAHVAYSPDGGRPGTFHYPSDCPICCRRNLPWIR